MVASSRETAMGVGDLLYEGRKASSNNLRRWVNRRRAESHDTAKGVQGSGFRGGLGLPSFDAFTAGRASGLWDVWVLGGLRL